MGILIKINKNKIKFMDKMDILTKFGNIYQKEKGKECPSLKTNGGGKVYNMKINKKIKGQNAIILKCMGVE